MNEQMVSLSSTRSIKGFGVALACRAPARRCASGKNHAPVEDRAVGGRSAATIVVAQPSPGSVPAQPAADATKPLPGAENAGKPGYYTVKPGDTMIRIGLETGQNWNDLVKWNNLDNPNVIEVGQVLRVVPPGSDAGVSTRPVASAKAETRPLDAKPAPVAASGSACRRASPSTTLPAAATTAAAAGA